MAKRYQLAREYILQKMQPWLKLAIEEDLKSGKESRFVNQLSKEIISLAESDTIIEPTTQEQPKEKVDKKVVAKSK